MNISQNILNAPIIPRKKYFPSLQPIQSFQFIGNNERTEQDESIFYSSSQVEEPDFERRNFWRRSLFTSENSILNVMISYNNDYIDVDLRRNNGGFMNFHEEYERRSLCRRG